MLSESLLNLGRIHWYLVYAHNRMMEKRFVAHPPGKIHKPSWTEFGKEVENDEINWWVFKREHDIPTLRQQTTKALNSAQALKDAVKQLSRPDYDTLDELNRAYLNFANKYQKDISVILKYVEWLHERDELAPSILFNYRTWGSTRMADRHEEAGLGDLDDENKIENLAHMVTGILQRQRLTFERVQSEMEYEAYVNIDHETYSGHGLLVPIGRVERRAARDAVAIFLEYFEELRDSFRSVMHDIEMKEIQDRLFTSDDFWRSFILKAASSIKTEQKYWDFKQTLDMWHIKNEPAKSEKANKFAEIVAGFANNQGGVIIVGVTDDPPRQVLGLTGTPRDIENYMKHVRNVVSQYIPYDKDFIHLQQVNVPDEGGDYKLCLVIAVQQTVVGLSVKGLDGKSFSYPLREETGLVWKEQYTVGNNKIGTKSDNYNFLSVLQQFVNEEI